MKVSRAYFNTNYYNLALTSIFLQFNYSFLLKLKYESDQKFRESNSVLAKY
jgi:hypothetical protein